MQNHSRYESEKDFQTDFINQDITSNLACKPVFNSDGFKFLKVEKIKKLMEGW